MEESSNGKIEETEKVEREENDHKLDTEDAKQHKASTDENSESVKESLNAEEKESFLMQDLDQSGKGIEEDEVINIIVDSDELVVETSMETPEGIGETEIESKGIDETEIESKGIEGARESTTDNPNGGVEIEGENSTCWIDKDDQAASAVAAEVVEESSLNETQNSQVVTREIGIGDVQVEEKAPVIVDSSKPSPNAAIVGSNDALPETPQTPHVISVSQRTSWKSCCGIFQVLRRSNS